MKYDRKIIKNGRNSYYINIPKEVMEKYGWRERQWTVLTDTGRGRLEIKDKRRKK
jgi:bifunctional DNA-binding transcriptional regulator/antitoxin component of YhaV-PrlF toxin-antitoxin module